jgi:hypothetical protein
MSDQQKTPGRPFMPQSTGQGPSFLLGLGERYPMHIIEPALSSLRYQGFLTYHPNGSFEVSAAGVAYYNQLRGQ